MQCLKTVGEHEKGLLPLSSRAAVSEIGAQLPLAGTPSPVSTGCTLKAVASGGENALLFGEKEVAREAVPKRMVERMLRAWSIRLSLFISILSNFSLPNT